MIIYVDSSALVKRIVAERESAALEDYLEAAYNDHGATLVTSSLSRVEVARRLARGGSESAAVIEDVSAALTGFDVVPLDQCVEAAMVVDGPHMRALDALHIAAANVVDASDFITYDSRQADAAKAAGLAAHAPTTSASVSNSPSRHQAAPG